MLTLKPPTALLLTALVTLPPSAAAWHGPTTTWTFDNGTSCQQYHEYGHGTSPSERTVTCEFDCTVGDRITIWGRMDLDGSPAVSGSRITGNVRCGAFVVACATWWDASDMKLCDGAAQPPASFGEPTTGTCTLTTDAEYYTQLVVTCSSGPRHKDEPTDKVDPEADISAPFLGSAARFW